jgi:membrane associated rhomboid family serine protease
MNGAGQRVNELLHAQLLGPPKKIPESISALTTNLMMTPGPDPLLESILQQCAEKAPHPWYPSAYVQTSGVSRDRLDPYLDQLRMAGAIQLTEWMQGQGQGYVLTERGAGLLQNPRLRARLRQGEVPIINSSRQSQAPTDSSPWERGEATRAALTQPIVPRVTFLLIGINVVWFMAGLVLAMKQEVPLNQFIFGSTERILEETGAVSGADVYLKGQWLRLLTCCFVHVGLLHLAVNMYSLYIIGPLLEQLWGSWRFLGLYLIAGIGGSCGMLLDQPLTRGAGASGALWGVMASMFTWLLLNRRVLPPALVSMWQRQLLFTFLLNLFITFNVANISKGAHFGGGLVGLIAAIPMDYLRFGNRVQKWVAGVTLALIPVICILAVLRSFRTNGEKIEAAYRSHVGIELPNPEAVLTQAWQILSDEALPLVRQKPEKRNAGEVQQTLAHLRKAGTAVNQLIRFLSGISSVKSGNAQAGEQIRNALSTSREPLGRLLRVISQAEVRLDKSQTWTMEDERLFNASTPQAGQIETNTDS